MTWRARARAFLRAFGCSKVAETLAALCARLRDGVPARDFRPLEVTASCARLRARARAPRGRALRLAPNKRVGGLL